MRIGQVIGNGAYHLRDLIGRGGMGEVYLADGPNGTRAAVKFIRASEYEEDAEMLKARFRREAKIASSLRSEHIAAVLYGGVTQTGELYIVFEYLEGESLAARIARESTIAMRELAWIIDGVLKGLEVAHTGGVVHRDIKPANIFLERSPPRAKILDFGIAKRAHSTTNSSASGALTALDATIGSVTYMAPEQIGGSAHVDARADLYAVALVAFHCLTGKLPFVSAFPLPVAKTRVDALSLQSVTGLTWPAETEAWMRKLLARDPAARSHDARSAREAWLQCCALEHPCVRMQVETSPDSRRTTKTE